MKKFLIWLGVVLLAGVLVYILVMLWQAGVLGGDRKTYENKCSTYVVNEDGSEELVSYEITTAYKNGKTDTKGYLPDGTQLYTLIDGQFTYEDAYTDAIKQDLDKKLGAISLLGSGSEDLVYEAKKDTAGNTTDEYISSKSGAYPALHQVYEVLYNNI